jgi:hypothetical protein
MKIRKVEVAAYAAAASAFFGVADFLGVAFFAAAFLGAAAFLATAFAGVLVTRPDLVLPRTLGSSTIAGAWRLLAETVARRQYKYNFRCFAWLCCVGLGFGGGSLLGCSGLLGFGDRGLLWSGGLLLLLLGSLL